MMMMDQPADGCRVNLATIPQASPQGSYRCRIGVGTSAAVLEAHLCLKGGVSWPE